MTRKDPPASRVALRTARPATLDARRTTRLAGRAAAVAALVLGTLLGACDDSLLEPRWSSDVDTVRLFSLARPELNLPSAFGFNNRQAYRVEGVGATGAWDIALDTRDGELVFLPAVALGISSRARIGLRPGVTFEEVREAPTDSAQYSGDDPLPVELGAVYVVRTGESVGVFGRPCVYFAKMEPVEMDTGIGTVRFRFEASPVCNDPRLVPTVGGSG